MPADPPHDRGQPVQQRTPADQFNAPASAYPGSDVHPADGQPVVRTTQPDPNLFRPGRKPVATLLPDAGQTEPAPARGRVARGVAARMTDFWTWARVHLFRLWTALAVLGGFGYLWVNHPEYLTWWKRTVNGLVDAVCDRLPYPWGDRIGSTIGNFGIWVQLTLAILEFRAVIGLVLLVLRRRRASRS